MLYPWGYSSAAFCFYRFFVLTFMSVLFRRDAYSIHSLPPSPIWQQRRVFGLRARFSCWLQPRLDMDGRLPPTIFTFSLRLQRQPHASYDQRLQFHSLHGVLRGEQSISAFTMPWRVHLLACQRLLYRLSRRMRCQAAASISL